MNTIIDRDLLSIQEARILAEQAKSAQRDMRKMSQEQLDKVIDAMAAAISSHCKELAEMSADETGFGTWQDKLIKDRFVCEFICRSIKEMRCVGIIGIDEHKKTVDIGVPMGTIVSVAPPTNPVSTTIYTALIAIKSGNAVIFSPHPRASKTIARTLDILIEAAEGAGLPECGISYLHCVSKEGTGTLFNHKDVAVITITGVPKLLKMATATGKPVMYGTAGNGPVFIERTADVPQAIKDIVDSKAFDNGVSAASEQAVVVDGPVDQQVREEFVRRGAYFMTPEESDKLAKVIFRRGGNGCDAEMIGRTAEYLAKRAGFEIPKGTVLLISEQSYVSDRSPYNGEKLCPVLTYYVEEDWENACEKCIELLIGEKGHTLVIHSNDMSVIKNFALHKPVARVLVNTPGSFGALGFTTNLFPALTLGSGNTGEGFTTDNVSPKNLIYIRKVGFGVRKVEDIFPGYERECAIKEANTTGFDGFVDSDIDLEALKSAVAKILAGTSV